MVVTVVNEWKDGKQRKVPDFSVTRENRCVEIDPLYCYGTERLMHDRKKGKKRREAGSSVDARYVNVQVATVSSLGRRNHHGQDSIILGDQSQHALVGRIKCRGPVWRASTLCGVSVNNVKASRSPL